MIAVNPKQSASTQPWKLPHGSVNATETGRLFNKCL